MLLVKSNTGQWIKSRFVAVGRMAFTNYILQTLFCTGLFYGSGFGLFGELDRWQQVPVVFGVWALQLWYSPIWLRSFRFGPLEWFWRSLTYWKLVPFKRK